MSEELTELKAKRYSAVKIRFFLIDIFVFAVSLAVFQCFFSLSLSMALSGVNSNFYIVCLGYSFFFLTFIYLVNLPVKIAASFLTERRFELSDRSFRSWLTDEAKSTALSFALSIVCIQVFYLVLRNFPVHWWIITAFLWILFSIVFARILPKFLLPIFFKYLPLEDEILKEGIFRLADKAGIKLIDVCRFDLSKKTKKANAALIGLGKTHKVILADTLTENFTREEVEAVAAHEFGHYKYRHIIQLLAFSGIITIVGLFVLYLIKDKVALWAGTREFSDLYIFPLLMLLMTIADIIFLPAQNLFSRILERQADRFALDLTGDSKTFISVMRKLALMNLSDTRPSFLAKIFLYNHPPVGERIRMAEEFRGKDGDN